VKQLQEEAHKILSRREIPFSRRDVIRTMGEEAMGRGLGAAQVLTEADRFLSSRLVLTVGMVKGLGIFRTTAQLTMEEKLFRSVERLQGRRHSLGSKKVERVLAEHLRLSEEQKNLIRGAVGRGSGSLAVVGWAEPNSLLALSRIYEANRHALFSRRNFSVISASVSGAGADRLKDAGLAGSRTVNQLLRDLQPNRIRRETFNGIQFRSLTAMARYATKARRPRLRLTKSSVVILNEADTADTKELAELMRLVRKARSKLILVGSENAEARPVFREIMGRLGVSPAADSSSHQKAPGLAVYAKCVSKDKEASVERLITDWKRGGITAPEKHVVVAADEDLRTMNLRLQAER